MNNYDDDEYFSDDIAFDISSYVLMLDQTDEWGTEWFEDDYPEIITKFRG